MTGTPRRGMMTALATTILALAAAPLALAGCGPTARVVKLAPLAAPAVRAHRASPTASATALATCQPDPGGIFAAQPSFAMLPAQGPIPSLPLTKRGNGGSRYGNGVVTNAQSLCSLTTGPALDAYLASQLPRLGWQYGPPPGDLAGACGGSFFWSYTLCAIGGA